MLKCSTATIQAIELGKLKLSERLAQEIRQQTGVSLEWLMIDDPERLPINGFHLAYARSDFENAQANLHRKFDDETDPEYSREFLGQCLAAIASAMLSAIEKDQYVLFRYKTRQLLDELSQKFGNWPAIDNESQLILDVCVSVEPPEFQLLTDLIDKEMMKLFKDRRRAARAEKSKKRRKPLSDKRT